MASRMNNQAFHIPCRKSALMGLLGIYVIIRLCRFNPIFPTKIQLNRQNFFYSTKPSSAALPENWDFPDKNLINPIEIEFFRA